MSEAKKIVVYKHIKEYVQKNKPFNEKTNNFKPTEYIEITLIQELGQKYKQVETRQIDLKCHLIFS